METIVIVAVSILSIIFLASFGSLLYICYQRCTKKQQSMSGNEENTEITQTVLTFDDNTVDTLASNLELGSVITCDDGTIRQLLETEEWANDVHGIIPHCIAILKMCREVTEKLVTVAMENNNQNIHPSRISEIVVVAKYISPRVDDVMNALSPPFDPKLLEARSAALIYAVQHLALLLRNAWQSSTSLDWLNAAMDNMTQHMIILRKASTSERKNTKKEKRLMEQNCSDSDGESIKNVPHSSSQSSQL